MTGAVAHGRTGAPTNGDVTVAQVRLHRYAALVAAATFLLIIAGGLVTSTGSALAVPDWPLSFGRFFPPMEGGVLFEHGHRMVAATVVVLTIGLVLWTARVEPRRWVRRLAYLALVAVVLQGALGGATVLLRLPDAISVAHAGLAQLFFALTVVVAVVTSPRFIAKRETLTVPADSGARRLALVTAVAVYAQILVGAIVRHTGAGLAIPDFPLAFGRLVPPVTSVLLAWQLAHRAIAVIVVALVAWTAARVLRRHPDSDELVRPALALVLLAGFQVLLGALTIWTRRAVVPTTAHVAVGALLWVTAVVLAVRMQEAGDRGMGGLGDGENGGRGDRGTEQATQGRTGAQSAH